MFARLEKIYANRALTAEIKWKQWWNLLFPDAGEAPDPRHHDTIIISAANISAIQENFLDMLRGDEDLVALSETELKAVSANLEKLLRAAPIAQHCRRQSRQPRTPRTPATAANLQPWTPRTPATAENLQAIAHTEGPWSAYTIAPDPLVDWDARMPMVGDDSFNLADQGYPGSEGPSFDTSGSNSFGQGFGGSGNLPFGQNL
jgi:hypothetical protein